MAPSGELDELEDLPPEHDPVVRMPKRMASLDPEPAPVVSDGFKLIAAVGVAGALVGGALGAVGLGIVYATLGAAPAAVAHAASAPAAPSSAAAPDAGPAGDAADTDPPPPAPVFATSQVRLGRGRTLDAALRGLRVPRADAAKVVRALRGVINLRALLPEDTVAALRDPASNALRRVEYRRSPTLVFAALPNDTGRWRAERVHVVLSTARVASGFRVDTTVEAAAREGGFHTDVLPRLGEVLSAIGLGERLQPGDTVRVVVDEERMDGAFYRYGRVHGVDYRGALGARRGWWVPLGRSGELFDADGRSWARGPLRSPVPGARLSSRFDLRRVHPVLHVVRPHLGVDFAAPAGTPVYAAAAGAVLSVGYAGPSGNLVRLAHPALEAETGYAHLARFAGGLRVGQRVAAGQLVGYVGSTGRSTGPHLHFAVRRGGRFVDPLTLYVPPRAVPEHARAAFTEAVARVGAELDAIVVDGRALEPARSPGATPTSDGGTAPSQQPPAADEVPPPDGVPDEAPLDDVEERPS